MANITGKVNIPTIVKQYEGETTPTAETIIDNKENKISVNVNVEEVTKDCATKEELDALSDGLDNLSDRVDDLSDQVVNLTDNQNIHGDKTFEDITTFNDDTIFNGALIDKESNRIELKNISLATNIENGEGNCALIQTNTVLMSDNEWSSSDDSIATVDESGNVEAVAPGEATITCLREGAEATCLVTVKPRLLFSTLSSTSSISGYDIITDISEISSEDEIYLVAVSDNYKKQFSGNIVGVNTKYGESVDIVDNVALLTPLTITLKESDYDNEFTICYNKNKYLYWTSGNSLNAGQDLGDKSRWLISFEGDNALIINKSDTTRKIQYNSSSPRFACYNNNQASVMLVKSKQYSPIESLTLDEHELELDSGNEFKLSVEILPADADKGVTWTSSDSSIVSVDNEGNLTAGLLNVTSTATITVTSVSDTTKSDSCEVTVKKQNGPAIKLSSGHLKLRVGDTVQLTVKYSQTNIASGDLSIALGHSNNITGNTSTAIGSELASSYDNQIIIGKYNYNKNNTLFEVGNGTSKNRSNALEVYADGSVRVYKSPSNNNDVTNKNYVDNIPLKTINNESIKGSGNIEISASASWGAISGTLSEQSDLQSALNDKQDVLVSGTSIKTINNESILGEGNIDIQGGGSDFDHGGTMNGDLEVTGSITANTLSVSSDTDLSGNLSVHGTISSEGGFSGTLDGAISTNTPKDYVFVSLGDGFSRFRRNPLIISNEAEDGGYMDYVSEAIQNALDAQGSSVTISQDVAIRISNALVLWIKENGSDMRYKYPLAQGYDYVYSDVYYGGEYWFGSFYNSNDTYDYYFVKIENDSGFTLKLTHKYNS